MVEARQVVGKLTDLAPTDYIEATTHAGSNYIIKIEILLKKSKQMYTEQLRTQHKNINLQPYTCM